MDLRCSNKKHGEINDAIIEIKCQSRFCTGGPGIVVIHRWDAVTGEPLKDQRFKEPPKEGKEHGAYDHRAAVRHP